MPDVISLSEATKPAFSDKQEALMSDLIGIGLTRVTCIALTLNKDASKLNPGELSAGNRLIAKCKEQLGFGVMDARRAQSPFTAHAVRQCARNNGVRVRVA